MKATLSSPVTRHSSLIPRSPFPVPCSLVAALALATCASAATFRGGDDGRILRNPGCGLAFYYYSNSPDAYGPSRDIFIKEAPRRLVRLLDRIHDRSPGAKVVVTSLMPRWSTVKGDESGNWQYEAIANVFNPAVPRIVEAQRDKGRDAHFLDMHAAIGFDDIADIVHPNDVGYAKMAAAWLGAFTNLFPKAQSY